MSTILHESTTITETHCYASELLWDREMAEMFRQTLIRAIGRDCFCHEGESCWLMDSALKGVQTRSGEYVSLSELAATEATA